MCAPSEIVFVSNALAVDAVPPAKSYGGVFSVWRGAPVICGLSSQKRTCVISAASGDVNA